jgi:uncharacterized protein YecE (DUF72 family)
VAIAGYHLGCPSWGMKTWVGRLFPPRTKQAEFLSCYSRIFNSVEGNTTFYAIPKSDTIARWNAETPDDFRFCFKFPKKITHEKLLLGSDEYTAVFLKQVEPLGEKLGTLMLQLPPRYGPKQLERLGSFLRSLPRAYHYAVELRHPAFFGEDDAGRAVTDLLGELDVDRVIMDARSLHAGDEPEHAEARANKPNLPVVPQATGSRPIVRFVSGATFESGQSFIDEWIEQLARWIAEGKQPYFFVHAPDDTFAPEHALRIHRLLAERADVGSIEPWPGDADAQSSLFPPGTT